MRGLCSILRYAYAYALGKYNSLFVGQSWTEWVSDWVSEWMSECWGLRYFASKWSFAVEGRSLKLLKRYPNVFTFSAHQGFCNARRYSVKYYITFFESKRWKRLGDGIITSSFYLPQQTITSSINVSVPSTVHVCTYAWLPVSHPTTQCAHLHSYFNIKMPSYFNHNTALPCTALHCYVGLGHPRSHPWSHAGPPHRD